MSKVSIVIPVYNAELFLRETLESVKNQTFADFECVIVNDGSTDNSLDIINEYVKNDNRFRCISIANSGCANIPRNVAIRNSNAEFIFNLDADDVIDHLCIAKMVERQVTTNADIVLLRMIGCIHDLEGELWSLPLDSFNKDEVIRGIDAFKLTIGGWQIPCNGMFAKNELFQGIPEGNLFISDEIASRHLLYKASKVAFSDAKYFYRNNNNSITRAISPKLFERLLIDILLDDFITERFKIKDDVAKRIRNTRFFNMIYMYADFKVHKSSFDEKHTMEISLNFKKSYRTQKIELLKEELPKQFSLLFLTSFNLFKIVAPLYVFYKTYNGRNYIFK
jgi:glycosyltransferase involved in cell wall biosynthesis